MLWKGIVLRMTFLVYEQGSFLEKLAVVGNLASLQNVTVGSMEDAGLLDLTLEVFHISNLSANCPTKAQYEDYRICLLELRFHGCAGQPRTGLSTSV